METYGVNSNSTGAYTNSTGNELVQSLGKDEFLELLITSLRYQDALNPVDDKEFIAQMAQFSSLEQMNNLNETLEKGMNSLSDWIGFMASQSIMSNFNSGLNFLGREITYINDGKETSAVVTGVKQVNGEVLLSVGDKEVYISDVISVG